MTSYSPLYSCWPRVLLTCNVHSPIAFANSIANTAAGLRIVTTEWVLVEFGDAYCDPKDRPDSVVVCRSLLKHPRVRIITADTHLFQRGVDFFEKRSDKGWSLTDCMSFVVMDDEGLREALTGDRDFEQAGFTALLK